MPSILSLSLIVLAALAVIILLIWKNKKDKKLLNPGAQDSVDETIMDQDRRKDQI